MARYSDRVLVILNMACHEAYTLKHGYVGTEHILLSMLRQEKNAGEGLFKGLGIMFDQVRPMIIGLVKEGARYIPMETMDRTPRCVAVVNHAKDEAELRDGNDGMVFTRNILNGLISVEGGVAFMVLSRLGLNKEKVHEVTSRVHAVA